MRPLLKGLLRPDQASGRLTWSGKWCMNENDFSNDSLTFEFWYQRSGEVPGIPEEQKSVNGSKNELKEETKSCHDGFYDGFFVVRSAAGSNNKFHERNVSLRFKPSDTDENTMTVTGEGSNRLGKYTLSGTYTIDTNELNMAREYSSVRRKSSARSAARVRSELGISAAPTGKHRRERNELNVDEVRHEGRLMEELLRILEVLVEKDTKNWFSKPVDATSLGLTDYHTLITQPMDLGTVRQRYGDSYYVSADDMLEDMELTFSNAIHYNPRGNSIYRKAVELLDFLQQRFKEVLESEQLAVGESGRPHSNRRTGQDKHQNIPRIGKRHSIPKIIYEPEAKQRKLSSESRDGSDDFLLSSNQEAHARGSRSLEDISENDIVSLRKQIYEMSKTLQSFGKTMAGSSGLTLDTDDDGNPIVHQGGRTVPMNEIVNLTQQVEDLPPEALQKVVEIIEDCGYKLLRDEEGQVELDFEQLDYDTFKKLRQYCRHQHRSLGL